MKQKIDLSMYGEPDGDGIILKELEEWCSTKGYIIKRGFQWNVVDTPSYTGADGEMKDGKEDTHLTHEIDSEGKVCEVKNVQLDDL